ncbi:MAG: hypothetical protein ABW051_11025 [Burkholderiaceae bacterium]
MINSLNSTGRKLLAALAATTFALFSTSVSAAGSGHQERKADFDGAHATADARYVADWVVDSRDNGKKPFVVVDKKGARIYVFDASGTLVGESAALMGYQPGDLTVPGVGKKKISQILPHERTTPAGRFLAQPGRNNHGEKVIWVEYNSGFAIHRVRGNNPEQRRHDRLATPSVADNKISLGCVVTPVNFFTDIVDKTIGRGYSVVYVLPETQPVRGYFDGAAQSM